MTNVEFAQQITRIIAGTGTPEEKTATILNHICTVARFDECDDDTHPWNWDTCGCAGGVNAFICWIEKEV